MLLVFNLLTFAVFAQTTFTAPVLQDTYVSSVSGTNPSASVINLSETSDIQRGLIQFDLSAIPYGGYISNAVFHYQVMSTAGPTAQRNYSIQMTPGSWNQSTVTFTGLPWSSDGTITDMPAPVNTSALNTGAFNINVTSMIDYMFDRKVLAGWKLLQTAGTATCAIASSNHILPAIRPRLVITYYNPVVVTALTIPATSNSSTDGSADISVTGGSGNFSYQWYDAASLPLVSTQDINSIAAGLYKLEVQDNVTSQFYRYFVIVGHNQGSLTINIQPDELFAQDNNVRSALAFVMGPPAPEPYRNYPIDNFLRSGNAGLSNPYMALLKFNYLGLEEYNNIIIENAVLNLYGNTHANSGLGTNFKIQRITQSWYEDFVTNNNQPTSTTLQEKNINPGPTSAAPDVSSNITNFVDYHSLNPTQNFGYFLKWYQTGSGLGTNNYVNFHSSSSATVAKRPMLSITFRPKKDYAELRKKTDGGIYNIKNFLNFRYAEEYNDVNSLLAYNIYRASNNQLVASQANLSLPVKYGDNRYSINVKTIITGGLSVDTYLLEVINEKNEKSYLRFKVN
ncbi:MAG: hypothetical protein K0S32_1223 [Bacteroidetes bacterium]|nr:hypothetical protein [Bacteroidota bacterium]